MKGIIRAGGVLALAAVIIAGVMYLSKPKPAYAEDVYSEAPYVTKSTKFVSKKSGSRITVRWNRASALFGDGTIADATGYQIQYSSSKTFAKKKTIWKSGRAETAVIRLPKLNTRKKYKKRVNKYYIRVRSYAESNGKKYYSGWCKAAAYKNIRLLFPAVITKSSVGGFDEDSGKDGAGQTVGLRWEKPNPDIYYDGYIVYNRKAGTVKWQKRMVLASQDLTEYEDKVGFEEEYEYAVLAYRYVATKDPRGLLNTSFIGALESATGNHKARVVTGELKVGTPELIAAFKDSTLILAWDAAENAKTYHIEIASDPNFTTMEYRKDLDALEEGASEYSYGVDDLKDNTEYYIRMRASASVKDEKRYSEYSPVKTAKFENVNYTIRFVNCKFDGTEIGETTYTVQRDDEFKLPANKFKKTGYTFAGWSTEKGVIDKTDLEKSVDVNWVAFQVGTAEYMDKDTVLNLAEADEEATLYACWRGSSPASAADWSKYVAGDDHFYYGTTIKQHCWFCNGGSKTSICNCFCAAAYQHGMSDMLSGFIKKTSSGLYSRRNGSTEPGWWEKEGFVKVGSGIAVSKIKKGDIICCHNSPRWSHVMIAATDGTAAKPYFSHAAGKGTDAKSINATTDMATKLKKYKKYTVLRYAG